MQYILTYKSYDGINTLINRLSKEDGYKIYHKLDDVYNLKEKVIGIAIDLDDYTVFQLGVTSMACYCGGVRKPLYAEEVLEHYDELIKKRNTKLYESLVKEKSKEKDRPGGVLLRIKD